MMYSEAEYYVNRIISGVTKCKLRDVSLCNFNLLIKIPSRYHRYIANEIYNEVYDECLYEGMFSDDELKLFMLENELWMPEDEEKLVSLQKDIEELKVRMFESSFNTETLRVAKRVIHAAKADVQQLLERKHCFNYLSASGMSEIEKNKFLIGMSLSYLDGKPFLDEENYWSCPVFILEQALIINKQTRIDEAQMRWLARNDPWRSYWMTRKSEGNVFGLPAVDLSDEQKALVIWSTIYDNVYENPERPMDAVIEDDDVLDGWFISQKRKREKEVNQGTVDQLIGNEKIRNSGEIFIPATSKKDLERIASLNDTTADIVKKQRLKYVEKHGEVTESQMPDTKNDIRKQRADMFRSAIKGNVGM